MKVTELAVSPTLLYLKGESESTIAHQAHQYEVDRGTMDAYYSHLETVLPQLVRDLQTSTSQLSPAQWRILAKPVIHLFVSFLFTIKSVENAKAHTSLSNDVTTFSQLYPQTLEQLLQALSYDQVLRETMCSMAEHLLAQTTPNNFFLRSNASTFSVANLTYSLTKKLLSLKPSVPNKGEKNIILFSLGNNAPFVEKAIPKNTTPVMADDFLGSLHLFPSQPDKKLRENLARDIELVFKKTYVAEHFSYFKNKHAAYLLSLLIGSLLPVSLVEQFSHHYNQVEKYVTNLNPLLVLTSTGHHNEYGNILLEICSQKGIPVALFQHGAGYAEMKSMQSERTIETTLYTHTYFSWGKLFKPVHSFQSKIKVNPVGGAYLNHLPQLQFRSSQIKTVLIPLEPLYFYQTLESLIPSPPWLVPSHIEFVISCIKHLISRYPSLRIIVKTKIGHDNQELILRKLTIEERSHIYVTSEGKTFDYFDRSSLVFLPYMSGAFVEALMAGVPFIGYLPPKQPIFKKEIKKLLTTFKDNHLVISNFNEFKKAFSAHYTSSINYQKLQPSFKTFSELVSRRNRTWKRDVRESLTRLMKK